MLYYHGTATIVNPSKTYARQNQKGAIVNTNSPQRHDFTSHRQRRARGCMDDRTARTGTDRHNKPQKPHASPATSVVKVVHYGLGVHVA
eukprot:5039752-Prymnesium_polylepis.1